MTYRGLYICLESMVAKSKTINLNIEIDSQDIIVRANKLSIAKSELKEELVVMGLGRRKASV